MIKHWLIRGILGLLALTLATCCWAVVWILYYADTRPVTAPVALVLGAGVTEDRPSPVFQARLDHAMDLYQQGFVQALLFTGGKAEGDPLAEAEVARLYALSQGVPDQHIGLESRSRTTLENLQFSRPILDAQGAPRVVIVSDPWHLARAQMLAAAVGIKATISGTPYSRYRTWRTQLPFILREAYFYWQFKLLARG